MKIENFHTPETRMGCLWGFDAIRIRQGANDLKWSRAELDRALYVCEVRLMDIKTAQWDAFKKIPREWIVEAYSVWGWDSKQSDFVEWQVPMFPVNGHDLLALGYTGPNIKKGLDFLKIVWHYNDYVTTKEELLKLLTDLEY